MAGGWDSSSVYQCDRGRVSSTASFDGSFSHLSLFFNDPRLSSDVLIDGILLYAFAFCLFVNQCINATEAVFLAQHLSMVPFPIRPSSSTIKDCRQTSGLMVFCCMPLLFVYLLISVLMRPRPCF